MKYSRIAAHGTAVLYCLTAFTRLARSYGPDSILQIGASYAGRISSAPSTTVGASGGGKTSSQKKASWAGNMCGRRLFTRPNEVNCARRGDDVPFHIVAL